MEAQNENKSNDTDKEIRSSYAVLGIAEGSDKELVEKKYGALLRQYKQRTDEYGATNEDIEYYNEITKAYYDIVGKPWEGGDTDPTNIIPYSVRKRWQRFSAYIDSYKLIICAVILVIVIALLTYMQIKDAKKDDIYIKFVGSFESGYSEKEEDHIDIQIAEKSEVVESPMISYFTVVDGETTMLDSVAKSAAMQFRSEFTSGTLDIIIIDKENLDVYVDQLVFLRLDDVLAKYEERLNIDDADLYYYENSGGEDKTESGIYAVEISDYAFFDGMNLNKRYSAERQTMYLAVARTSKRSDTAEAFFAEILSSGKKS